MKNNVILFFSVLCMAVIPGWCASQGIVNLDFLDLDDMIMSNSDSRDKPGTGGGGSGGDGGFGGGGSGINISINFPDDTKVLPEDLTIDWTSSQAKGPFNVSISNDENEVIYSILVSGLECQLPLSTLILEEGKTYAINVNSKTGKSKSAMFSLGSKEEMEKVLTMLKSNEEFSTMSPLKKRLAKALSLELNKYSVQSAALYKHYCVKDADDILLRNMRDEFRSRVGLPSVR